MQNSLWVHIKIHVYILASTALNHILKQIFTHPAFEQPTDLDHF